MRYAVYRRNVPKRRLCEDRISTHLKIFIIRDSDNSHKHNANIAESRSGDSARTESVPILKSSSSVIQTISTSKIPISQSPEAETLRGQKIFIIRDSDNSHKHNANIAESRSGDSARTECCIFKNTVHCIEESMGGYILEMAVLS